MVKEENRRSTWRKALLNRKREKFFSFAKKKLQEFNGGKGEQSRTQSGGSITLIPPRRKIVSPRRG